MKALHATQSTARNAKAKRLALMKAKANLKWQALRDAADVGASLAEACSAVGLTENGVRTILYRRTGSSVWPPKK